MKNSRHTIGLRELLSTRVWMVNFASVPAFRAEIERNLNEHVPFVNRVRLIAEAIDPESGVSLAAARMGGEDGQESDYSVGGIDKPFVSLLYVTDAIMRNDDACTGSMGSISHREAMKEAASNPNCLGHIFYLDTPGGSAAAMSDYELAIEYARKMGQPVIAFIDGLCCSAGMYIAALCDERYYMHPANKVGCIGTLAAFYTEKDGSYNQYTNETYHEIYDPESYDKNRAIRDIANENKDEALLKDLAKVGQEFREVVKAHCPGVTDDMLHGKVFDAAEVEGALVDGQNTLEGCIARVRQLRKDMDDMSGQEDGQGRQRLTSQLKQNPTQSNLNMKDYPFISKVLGLPEGTSLELTEDGAMMQTDLLDRIEQCLASADTEREQALADQHEADAARQDAAIADMQQQHNAALTSVQSERDSLQQQVDALTAERDQMRSERDALQQQLADVREELTQATATPQQTEESSPANNGAGLAVPKMRVGVPQWDPNKSPAENKKVLNDYMKSLSVG